MAGNGNRREAVAVALASGKSVKDAAAECQAGERTVHRWLVEDAAFRQRVNELRSELFGQAVGKLSQLAHKAADTLGTLLDSKSENIRFQAARAVLDLNPRVRETADVLQRLDALERMLLQAETSADDHA